MTASTTSTSTTSTSTTSAPTSTPSTPSEIARDVLAHLVSAWNAGDGDAFAAAYAADAAFVTIRGEHIVGRRAIAAGHAGIFASIYAGSVNRMDLVRADEVAAGVVRAVSVNTLDCPTGPLVGVHRATSTSVIARDDQDGEWRVVATHNTLMED